MVNGRYRSPLFQSHNWIEAVATGVSLAYGKPVSYSELNYARGNSL